MEGKEEPSSIVQDMDQSSLQAWFNTYQEGRFRAFSAHFPTSSGKIVSMLPKTLLSNFDLGNELYEILHPDMVALGQHMGSLSVNNAQQFIAKMEKVQMYSTLKKQREALGRVLKAPLPLGNDYPEQFIIDPFLLKQIGDTEEFTTALTEITIAANPQDRKVLAIANSSGAGKTKLCISFGLESKFLVLIRLKINDRRSKSLETLIEWLQKIKSELQADSFMQGAKDALNAMRLFIFAHLQWIRELLEAQKSSKLPDSFQRELCVRGLENGDGELAVHSIFAVWKEQYSDLNNKSLENLFQEIITALPKGMAIVYDEVAALKKVCPGLFFHEDDFKSFDTEPMKFEQDNGTPFKYRDQVADAFYGIRLIMKELLDGHYYPQMMADSHLSIWDVGYDPTSSPLRGRLQKWTKLHRFTTQDMMDCLAHYWSVADTPRVKDCLQKFEGRAIFFCNKFLVALVRECNKHKPSSQAEFEKIIENITGPQFDKSISELEGPVLRVMKNTTALSPSLPTMQQVMFSLYSSIYLTECKYKLQHDEHLRQLVICGIFAPQSIEFDSPVIDLHEEPVLFEAVKRVGDNAVRNAGPNEDPVFSILNARFGLVHTATNLKGDTGEDALSWFLIRQFVVRSVKELTLKDLLDPLLATPLTQECASLKVQLDFCGTDEFPQCLLKTGILWQKLSIFAGPDHAFSFLSKAGTMVIQAKAKEDKSFDLEDALRSINPGFLYTTEPQRKLYKGGDPPMKNPWVTSNKLRGANHKCFSEHPWLMSLWVRCIFSVAPFRQELVDRVCTYNQTDGGSHSPLFLLQGSAACFGSYLHTTLVKNCGTRSIGGDASLETVPYESFAQFEHDSNKKYQKKSGTKARK